MSLETASAIVVAVSVPVWFVVEEILRGTKKRRARARRG